MSSQKLEYDSSLGGRVTLPSHVTTYHYAAGALQEIRNLIADSEQTTQRSSKLIFQTLPKHMRRRAMSHHPKRLPRKYRQAHKSQMGKGGNQPVNGKRPSRKYRRRPQNLLREYIRRQRRHIWLETHIWHAKRFHMVDRWGHRLAFASCDKTYRACYRASAQHCLLQDISFYGCVELRGSLQALRQGFARLTSPECGLGIAAKTYISGRREGSVELFADGQYPHGALQRVSFLWRPKREEQQEEQEDQEERTLWLWLHPSAAQATIEQLLLVFNLKSKKQQKLPLKEEEDEEMEEVSEEKEELSEEKEKPNEEKKKPSEKKEKLSGEKEKPSEKKEKLSEEKEKSSKEKEKLSKEKEKPSEKMEKLSEEKEKFREKLKRSEEKEKSSQEMENTIEKKEKLSEEMEKPTKEKHKLKENKSAEKPLRFWTHTKPFEAHPSYSNPEETLHLILLQRCFNRFRLTGPRTQQVLAASLRPYVQDEASSDYCQAALKLTSPSELLSNLVMGYQVVDPRLQRPKKRTKAEESPGASSPAGNLLINQPKSLPESPLWDKDLRESLLKGILPTHSYEQLRQQHAVVPGAPCAFEQEMQGVPLILIQRPGSQESKYKRLSYGCGWDVIVPAGYGMILWLTLTMWGARPGGLRELDSVAREAAAEMHLPDTVAGIQESAASADELRGRYFRLPPNKRSNYRKLAVVSPFSAPWKLLVRDWSASSSPASFYVLRHRQQLERIAESLRQRQLLPEPLPEAAIIQIHLRLVSRGNVKDNALICLPTAEDHKHRWRQLKRDEASPVHVEPALPDLNERERKELRQSHKLKLKRLRARRVREKRRLQETATKRVHIRPANTSHLVRSQLEAMCRLWLPTDPAELQDSVRRQCSRQTFGYVRSAGFSFTEAKVCAVGYVTAAGLQQLLKELPPGKGGKATPLMCLVRDPDSRDYRWASFQVNLNVASPAF